MPTKLASGLLIFCGAIVIGCKPASSPRSAEAAKSQSVTPASIPQIVFSPVSEKHWTSQWAQGKTGRVPQWAGGFTVLVWPEALDDKLPAVWANEHHLLGLAPEAVQGFLGPPQRVILNESVDTALWLYPGWCVSFHQDRCDGLTPRSPNYEKWFAQPDL